jgi:hypothetical protein
MSTPIFFRTFVDILRFFVRWDIETTHRRLKLGGMKRCSLIVGPI